MSKYLTFWIIVQLGATSVDLQLATEDRQTDSEAVFGGQSRNIVS